MSKIIGSTLPNIPWQDRPKDNTDVVWRYDGNPILTSKNAKNARSVLNSAVVPFEDGYAGIFRVDDKSLIGHLHVGKSKDGINWTIDSEQITFITEDNETAGFFYGFDPRICFIEDRYYITWCNVIQGEGSTSGLAYTFDFKTFYQLPNIYPLYNRNTVLFPKKIDGKFGLLNRPTGRGHCVGGSIYYSESPDMIYWGKHRLVMQPKDGWQGVKIGAGPIPIETDEGWLLFYHGVTNFASGFMYSMGAALLDKEKPWRTLYRTKSLIMGPDAYYERVGDCNNVVFPCAALTDSETGRIAIYYGAADTVVGLAFCKIDEIIDYVKKYSF